MTTEATPVLRRPGARRFLAAIEVGLALVAILLDLLVPSLVLLGLAAVSLAVRREGPATLGLRRPAHPGRMVLQVGAAALGWTLLTFLLIRPVLEHLLGTREDMSSYAALQGDVPALLGLLLLGWTLAAVGEELAYRGYLLTRLRELLPGGPGWTVVAGVVAAVLFGWLHREYGVVGVVQVTLDALFFTALRFGYRSLWAGIVAHGVIDTVGIVAVFLLGPVAALW